MEDPWVIYSYCTESEERSQVGKEGWLLIWEGAAYTLAIVWKEYEMISVILS